MISERARDEQTPLEWIRSGREFGDLNFISWLRWAFGRLVVNYGRSVYIKSVFSHVELEGRVINRRHTVPIHDDRTRLSHGSKDGSWLR